MKTKEILIAFLLSLIFTHVANIGGYFFNWFWQVSISGWAYFLVTYFYLRKENSFKIKLLKSFLVISGFYIQIIIASLIDNQMLFPQVLPIIITPMLASLLAVLVFSTNKTKTKTTLITLVFIFFLAFGNIGMPNWVIYVVSEKPANQKAIPSFELITRDSLLLNSKTFSGHISVIDFYGTYCATCYRQMPEFDALREEYENHEEVKFYAVHLPTKHDSLPKSMQLLDKYNYGFTKLYCIDTSARRILNIYGVPEYMIIDQNARIVYRGPLNTKWYEFVNPAKKLINNLLANQSD